MYLLPFLLLKLNVETFCSPWQLTCFYLTVIPLNFCVLLSFISGCFPVQLLLDHLKMLPIWHTAVLHYGHIQLLCLYPPPSCQASLSRLNDKEGYVPRNLLGLYPRIKPRQRSLAWSSRDARFLKNLLIVDDLQRKKNHSVWVPVSWDLFQWPCNLKRWRMCFENKWRIDTLANRGGHSTSWNNACKQTVILPVA